MPGGRSWIQIFNDAKQKRNILEKHLNTAENIIEKQMKPRGLNDDQLSDFLLKTLKINESDCIGLDYFYGYKEIDLKEGVDVSPYLHLNSPIKNMDHDIIVKRQETNLAIKMNEKEKMTLEQEALKKDLPVLQENLVKTNSELAAIKKQQLYKSPNKLPKHLR